MSEFLAYQQALIDERSGGLKVVVHGRRVGATIAAAARAVELESKEPVGTLYLAPSQGQADAFIGYCQEHIERIGSKLRAQPVRLGQPMFIPGQTLAAMAYNDPQSMRILRGRRLRMIVDQAAYIPGMRELYAAIAMMPDVLLLSDWAEEAPGVWNWFNSLAKNLKRERSRSLHVIDFDRALHDGLYRLYCQHTGLPYSKMAEQFWRNEMIELHGKDAGRALFCGMPESELVDNLVVH